MRSKNPELMEKISRYIGDYYRKAHRTPTVRAIADGVGLSKSAVYNYLREMNNRGMISYEDGVVADLPKINKTETGFFSAPLVGSIRCGDPETEEEQVEMYISLPEALFGRGDFYLLRAAGDSMVDAGITEGDLILIKKQPTCDIGDIKADGQGNWPRDPIWSYMPWRSIRRDRERGSPRRSSGTVSAGRGTRAVRRCGWISCRITIPPGPCMKNTDSDTRETLT